jgi:hypothetical protein
MKLRILDNTVRFRLSQSEVRLIRDQSLLRATVRFPEDSRFEYVLESSPASVTASARFSDGAIHVVLPESKVNTWADSDLVAIECEQAVGNGEVLRLLVEKDFKCLSPRDGENETDMFPHPDSGRRNC